MESEDLLEINRVHLIDTIQSLVTRILTSFHTEFIQKEKYPFLFYM